MKKENKKANVLRREKRWRLFFKANYCTLAVHAVFFRERKNTTSPAPRQICPSPATPEIATSIPRESGSASTCAAHGQHYRRHAKPGIVQPVEQPEVSFPGPVKLFGKQRGKQEKHRSQQEQVRVYQAQRRAPGKPVEFCEFTVEYAAGHRGQSVNECGVQQFFHLTVSFLLRCISEKPIQTTHT